MSALEQCWEATASYYQEIFGDGIVLGLIAGAIIGFSISSIWKMHDGRRTKDSRST